MTAAVSDARPRLGLAANWRQFTLLAVVNAFVGAMVGMERTVVPLLAEQDFGIASASATLSFLVAFGIVKAATNLAAGHFSDRYGRKPLLVAGWVAALPVAPMIIWAPNWGFVVAANVFLGVNQGLAWSTTVIMKIDLVGPARRGFAMGLNEAAGYVAVSLAALATGYLAATYALRPEPFYLGVALALAGLILSACFVRESHGHARHEAGLRPNTGGSASESRDAMAQPSFGRIFVLTSWKNRALFSVSQAGLVNNLNDGMAWGLFPLFFAAAGLDVEQIGLLAAIYPGVWGVSQLATGAVSDRLGRKGLIVAGMSTQAVGIFLLLLSKGFLVWAAAMALLGLGTALVYPTLLAAISDVANPEWRASAVGVYRLWRDGGYAAGALLAGALSDLVGVSWAIAGIGLLTGLSGLIVLFRMYETLAPSASPPRS
jgi:MFS family permease